MLSLSILYMCGLASALLVAQAMDYTLIDTSCTAITRMISQMVLSFWDILDFMEYYSF